MTEIYLAENHLLLETGYGNPQMHSHYACHILVGLHGNMRVITDTENTVCRGALLPSGMAHTVDSFGKPLLVFLLDTTSTAAEQIQSFTLLDEQIAEEIAGLYQKLAVIEPEKNYGDFLAKVMDLAGIHGGGSRITDERIIQAVRFVEKHLRGNVTAKQTAGEVFLSESRFSHLFREQTGIAFSSYLVFRKLFCAYMQIAEGASITEASLAAGFSTPSHFATVNKKMFGITATDLSEEYHLHKI
ncbi:MAG: AraC family transcriptional regulator [Lachnospiraceae bacterium]|nr:AraC family transcriptional regulator [Lachnospiraceae bacterium]